MVDDAREQSKTSARESYQAYVAPIADRTDWWSRLMAFGAMLLAGAALVNSMVEGNFIGNGLQLARNAAQTADDGLGAVTNGMADSANEATGAEPESTAAADISPTTTEPDSTAAPETVAAADPTANTDSEPEGVIDLFEEEAPAEDTVSDASMATDTDGDVEVTLPDDDLLELLDKNPVLQIVRTAMRPTGANPTATLTIRNTGSGDAVITDAVFTPSRVVELPYEVATGKIGITEATKLVVAFTGEDNQAVQAGRHADYKRRLRQPFTVPAGNTVEIQVAIQNEEFAGYGFEGDMRLIFNDDENLEASGLTIAFVQ